MAQQPVNQNNSNQNTQQPANNKMGDASKNAQNIKGQDQQKGKLNVNSTDSSRTYGSENLDEEEDFEKKDRNEDRSDKNVKESGKINSSNKH
jgi:hypothetical protein